MAGELSFLSEAVELLGIVYSDLYESGKLKEETIKAIKMFYEDHDAFIDIYVRELRRKAGCDTYTDSKGKIRMTATGELDPWEKLSEEEQEEQINEAKKMSKRDKAVQEELNKIRKGIT